MQQPDAETIKQELVRAYMVTFSSAEGQVVLADLQAVYGGSSITSDFNPNRTMVLEGARLVYLKILEMIDQGRMYGAGADTRLVTTDDYNPEFDSEPEERQRPIFRFEG